MTDCCGHLESYSRTILAQIGGEGDVIAVLAIRNGHTKNNLPRDQEGYDGYETTYEKLSPRRIY